MPPAISALDALLFRDWEQEVWRSYQAGTMRAVATSLGAKNLPRYESLIDIDNKKDITPEQALEKRRRMIAELNAG